ncbi:MAG: glycosyltransferase [Terracidiphilus sp.]
MKENPVRVALFPDSLHEVNGVANTFRHFADYAQMRGLPLLVVHGSAPDGIREAGSVRFFGLKRGRFSFPVEKDLGFDMAFARHIGRVHEELRRFRPDVVHITGPSDIGLIGAIAALQLGIPLAASWHTNIHEYAARRTDRILPKRLIRGGARAGLLKRIEDIAFQLLMLHFKLARFYFAPNSELIERLQTATKKPCWLMERGIDLELFGPQNRTRKEDGEFVIGYVGRLSTEKKIRSFAPLAQALSQAGHGQVRFVFVGHGREEKWLQEQIPGVRLTGVLKGEALSRAYADLDLFVFFSETDTFGNAVLEALASGVPALVSDKGGPKFIVKNDCGFVCASDDEFLQAALLLIEDQSLRRTMSLAARKRAELASWEAVFDSVYHTYECELRAKDGAFENKTLASTRLTQNV